MGNYWSTDRPIGIAAVRSEKAIPPVWGDGTVATLNHGFSAEFKAKTPFHAGLVGPQRGPSGETYGGGTNQTYISKSWTHGYTAGFEQGTPIYSGTVASQTGLDGTVYPGGTPQVHIPDAHTHGEIINDWELN